MHVPALKRTTPHQFVGLALVLGLAASLALNAAMLTRSDDGATQHAVVHVESIGPEQGRFLEERNARIDAGPSEAARVARVAAWGRFMEDRIANLDAGYSEATRVARLAAWGQFLEERNAKSDVDRDAADQKFATTAEALPLITYAQQPYMGEGRDNVAALRSADALPFITYAAPQGMGKGWVGGTWTNEAVTSPALIAYTTCGQGEGLLQHGVQVENPCR